MNRHFDVIILGRTLGSLCVAALLSRRDFRVLLLGQSQKSQTYQFEGRVLCRRSFNPTLFSAPGFKRLLHELAQTQRFRQRVRELDPMFWFLSSEHRLEVPPDMQLFAREVEREFPEVRQLIEEAYADFAHKNGLADAVFERDAVWPPGSFRERFETGRLASALPLTGEKAARDVLAKFPREHTFRTLVSLPAQVSTDLASSSQDLIPFVIARLHGSWTRGIQALPGSEEELAGFLIDRIKAHGGEVDLGARAEEIVVRHGRAHGVRIDGDEAATGGDAIVCDFPGEAVADLAHGQGVTRDAQRNWPKVTARVGRFVTSVLVRKQALPEPLGSHAFLMPDPRSPGAKRRPPVKLEVHDPEHLDPSVVASGERLLVAELLLPRSGTLTTLEARQATLQTLSEHLPFLDEHLLLVDSPHDGLPLYSFLQGRKSEIERVHVRTTSTSAEPMVWQWSIEPSGYVGICGEPVRGPIPGTYLVGSTVVPALGQEGQVMAAHAVARLITQKDGQRQKFRRPMWSKIET